MINAIIAAWLRRSVSPRCISRYYVDDNCIRLPSGRGPWQTKDVLGVTVDSSKNELRGRIIVDLVATRGNYPLPIEKRRRGQAVPFRWGNRVNF